MSLAVCRAPLLWMNLALGNLVVFLVYGESGRVPFFGLASTVPYTVVAFVLFAVLYPRVTARTSWWVLAAWGGLFSLGVPVLGGFFWGAGHAVVDDVVGLRPQVGEAEGLRTVHVQFPWSLKTMGTRTQDSIAVSPRRAGTKRQRATASRAARSRRSEPELLRSSTCAGWPSGDTSTRSVTWPSSRRRRDKAG